MSIFRVIHLAIAVALSAAVGWLVAWSAQGESLLIFVPVVCWLAAGLLVWAGLITAMIHSGSFLEWRRKASARNEFGLQFAMGFIFTVTAWPWPLWSRLRAVKANCRRP